MNFDNEILNKSVKRALNGGISGSCAMIVQVSSLMWLRTTMNHQYRYGGTTINTIKKLYNDNLSLFTNEDLLLYNITDYLPYYLKRSECYNFQYNCISKTRKIEVENEIKDDLCSICFMDFEENEELIKCPECKKVLHKECMEKWLDVGNITCVYCRSEVWKDYGTNKSLDGNYICLE